jgi:hypothetical protein
MEHQLGTAEAEVLCCAHELNEVWNRKGQLVEEYYSEFLEECIRENLPG